MTINKCTFFIMNEMKCLHGNTQNNRITKVSETSIFRHYGHTVAGAKCMLPEYRHSNVCVLRSSEVHQYIQKHFTLMANTAYFYFI